MKKNKHKYEPEIKELLDYSDGIIATLREPFLILDKRLNIIFANRSFCVVFKTAKKDIIGRAFAEIDKKSWNIPKLVWLLKKVIPAKKTIRNYEIEHKFEKLGRRVMVVNARQLRMSGKIASTIATASRGEVLGKIGREEKLILLAIEDITERKRLQEELKESEQRFRRAFETSRDGLLLIHKTSGSIVNSNASAMELLGYSSKEFLKKKLWEIGAVKNYTDFQNMEAQLEKDGIAHYDEAYVKTKNGKKVRAEMILVNKAKVLQCNIRDITERRRLEEDVSEFKDRQYRVLVENLPQKIFLKNAKSIYISCNENYARDLKIRAEDIAGKTDYDFFPTHLAEKYRADDKRVMSSGKIENIEERFIAINDFLKDSKREVFINTVKAPIHDKDGKVVGIVGIFWDITESKEARQALLISEGKMRAVFDQASQFIGLMTVDGVLIEANKTAMNFAGIKESDCIGKYFWDTPWWTHSKDMQDKLRAAVKKVAKGETVLFEATHLDVNRRVHYVDFSLKPVRDQNGKVTFLIPEGRDVTDRKQNEEEITELHKMIEFILGATKTGLDIIDSNFNMVYIDPEWRRVYGDPTGRKCYEYFMGRSKECPGCGLRKAFETQKQVVTEEVLAREGNRPIQVTTIPFQDKRGRWLAAEVNVDITERKRIDKELEKHREHLEELVKEKTEEIKSAEAKFRLLFEDSKDCILLADVDTKKFTTFNMTACNILGYTPQEMEGISICDIHPKEELQHVLDMFEKMVAGKKNMVENVPVKKKDGSIFYADISGSAINISGKRYVMGNFRDITERKKAEEALRLSEASYRAIFDSANDAIVIRDINTFQIIDVNKKACEMFCYPRQEFIGLPMGTITADSSQGTLNKLKHFYDETAKGNPQIFEWLAKDKFGREFWVEINMKKAVVAGQYRLIYIARDITERRLNTAQKEDFINMIAHEVRAPLATIREGISLVLEGNAGPVEEKMKEVLQMTKNNIDRLNRLINTVLDLQKINIGKVELNLEEHNINETISEVCKEMMPSVEKKGLDIILELDDKLPAVKFDRDKISEVLINIINNAIKVMEKGDITIRSAFKKDHVRISVKDSGPGIKKDDIFKLFKQFSQLDKSSGGTGLGLVISKAIIDLHGGAIGVESEYGKGATFYFTLKI